jgi:hypothetical protein
MLNEREIEETFKSLGLIEIKDRERILSQGIISSEKTEIMQYKLSTDSTTDFF